MESKIVLKGHGYFERRKKDGSKIDSWECENLIVTMGKVEIAKLLNNVGSPVYFKAIAVGEGTSTPVVVGEVALGDEVKRSVNAILTYEATGKAVFEYTFDFGTAESYAITEAGIFNDETPSSGDMLDRFVWTPAKDVDVDTDLYVKITITVS